MKFLTLTLTKKKQTNKKTKHNPTSKTGAKT